MGKTLDQMTPEEEAEYLKELKGAFIYFLEAIPFISYDDSSDGRVIKLRTQVGNGHEFQTMLFELQWMLHTHKKTWKLADCRMIVSDIILSPEMPGTTFLRGIMVRIKYVDEVVKID